MNTIHSKEADYLGGTGQWRSVMQKVFAGHPVLPFSPRTTVSSDPLTNVTVTLSFPCLAG